MALNLVNLDGRTRDLMIQEIDNDATTDALYIAQTLNPQGMALYPVLLKTAAEKYDDSWLMQELFGQFNATYSYLRKGRLVVAKMPHNAAERLAEGEFNRFYLRGLSLRAMQDGIENLIIYRAKVVSSPRIDSEMRIGATIPTTVLLKDLRTHQGVDTALGLPPGPNSGLSAKLP